MYVYTHINTHICIYIRKTSEAAEMLTNREEIK